MTVIERIAECKKCTDFNADTVEKLIALAYFIGREEATREMSDKYNAIFKEQRLRANDCRYHRMAMNVIGNTNYIYSPDYAGDVKTTFGSDETEV